jgi:hypothetical protein
MHQKNVKHLMKMTYIYNFNMFLMIMQKLHAEKDLFFLKFKDFIPLFFIEKLYIF